jgi:predicted Fe-Mo cluster-binding NifX family protein
MKKVAIPVSKNNQVDDHFGHCRYYNIYTISENNSVLNVEQLPSEEGCGCKSNIASVLAEKGVQVMLAGGIGAGAINVLNKWNISVIRGCSGDVGSLILQYTDNLIVDSGETCAHTHGEKHQCNH